jgi:hypothetical protein
MKFLVSWGLPSGTFNAAVDRFLSTGGLPPKGVNMIGRWHGMSGRGCAVVETKDAKALYTWVSQWADLLPLEVTPVVEDAEAGKVLASLRK